MPSVPAVLSCYCINHESQNYDWFNLMRCTGCRTDGEPAGPAGPAVAGGQGHPGSECSRNNVEAEQDKASSNSTWAGRAGQSMRAARKLPLVKKCRHSQHASDAEVAAPPEVVHRQPQHGVQRGVARAKPPARGRGHSGEGNARWVGHQMPAPSEYNAANAAAPSSPLRPAGSCTFRGQPAHLSCSTTSSPACST